MALDRTYQALADPSRRFMLRRLSEASSLTVSDLAEPLAIGLPTVMKHLDVLARAGLITRLKTGRTVAVTFAPEPMAEAMAWLEGTESFWAARLTRLADVVERETS